MPLVQRSEPFAHFHRAHAKPSDHRVSQRRLRSETGFPGNLLQAKVGCMQQHSGKLAANTFNRIQRCRSNHRFELTVKGAR